LDEQISAAETEERLETRRLRRRVIDVILVILAVAASLWILFELRKILLLLALSVLFAFLVDPLVRPFERPFRFRGKTRVLPRLIAVLLVYALIGVVLVFLGGILAPRLSDQMAALAGKAPEYGRRIEGLVQQLSALPSRYHVPPEWRSAVSSGANRLLSAIMGALSEMAMRAVQLTLFLPWLVLIPVIGLFLLKDGEAFQQLFLQALPRFNWRFRMAAFLSDVGDALAAYIRAQLMSCLVVGVIVTIGLSALGAPYAVVLGSVAGLLEFIPLVGPLSIMVGATLIAALESPRLALLVLVFLLVVRGLQDYVVYPKLVGRHIEMHPLVVILAVLCGAELGGVTGVFLSVPVAALLIVALRHARFDGIFKPSN
jgi:predicted PurR-regulated permease PerM